MGFKFKTGLETQANTTTYVCTQVRLGFLDGGVGAFH